MTFRCLIIGLLILGIDAFAADAQDVRDTISFSKIISERNVRDVGMRIVNVPDFLYMVSATGEADVIKYIQTLPGVSTGAEGASAIYVRGGNIGSNLITLDGVSIYGGSHLLGLTGSVSSDIVSETCFRVGGFQSDECNITASHIGIKTVDGDFDKSSFNVSVSSFILGSSVSMPIIKNKLSVVGALRISPLGLELRAIKPIVRASLDSISHTRAIVFDAFAKVKWLINKDNSFSFSLFASQDAYSYRYGGYSDERMGWNNLIFNARHEGRLRNGWSVEDGVAYNHFGGRQGLIRDLNGTVNNLAIVNSLDEITADVLFHRMQGAGDIKMGVKERFARFNPGTSSTFKGSSPWKPLDSPRTDNISHASITTFHGQYDFLIAERLSVVASARLNIHYADESESSEKKFRIDPEAGLICKMNLTQWLMAEATADWTAQYYHTLEGVPLGWSMDLIVPTGQSRPPEKAQQLYAGLLASFGHHRITVGSYTKQMRTLVYFADASQLFSPAIAGWSHNVKVGSGTSRGIEFLYEKDGNQLDLRLAYTLSKTDRTFTEVNGGVPFPAKFDRRHILNANAFLEIADNERRSISMTGMFTLQSGHMETVAAGEYPAVTFQGQQYKIDYFTSVNNYRMPSYIRLDIGCNIKFKTRRQQELNVGIYNVLNRHNPFSIIYDNRSHEWLRISLLPIMPSFNYRIMFN